MNKIAWKRVIDIVITILTAIAATIGTQACTGQTTQLTALLGL